MKIFATLFFAQLFTLNVFGSGPNSFCHSPEATLCNRVEGQQAKDIFSKLKSAIANEAKAKALIRYESELPKGGPLKKLRTSIAREKILNQEIIFAAQNNLGHFEKNIVTNSNIEIVKKYLTSAVNSSNLSKKYKNKFKNIINNKVIVGNYMDFMERTKVTSSYFKQLWRAHCGMDGMSVNAFATTADWKKYVLICPGLLVKLNSLKNSQELTNEIFLILAHEISHHMDSGKFKKAYEEMANCYQKEIGFTLNRRNGRKCEKDDSSCRMSLKLKTTRTKEKCSQRDNHFNKKACELLGKTWHNISFKRCIKGVGEVCLKTVTWNHLGEISADYWASHAMGLYMRDRNFPTAEGVEFLRVNFEILCGSGDEGIHIDSPTRGNYIIGGNPVIRNQLTCHPAAKRYCEI